jgi:hypothetical protein
VKNTASITTAGAPSSRSNGFGVVVSRQKGRPEQVALLLFQDVAVRQAGTRFIR